MYARATISDHADGTAIKVDRNFGYAVFVSYAEVYNEKVSHSPLACLALTTDIRLAR